MTEIVEIVSHNGLSEAEFIAQETNFLDFFPLNSYFNDDEEKDEELEYLPAPGSPAAQSGRGSRETKSSTDNAADSDDSDDPLDKFMQGIEVSLLLEATEAFRLALLSLYFCIVLQEEVDKLKSNEGKKKKEDDSKKAKRYSIRFSSLTVIKSASHSYLFESRNVRDDIEQEDEMEAYLRFMEENPNVGVVGDEDEIYEYDEEGNVISMEKKVS